MTDNSIEYKGKKISFDGVDGFKIAGSTKKFSSVAAAKKSIDKVVPDKPFVPFSFVEYEVARHADDDAPRVVTISAVRYESTGRSYNRGLRFIVKGENREIREGWHRAEFFKEKDLPMLQQKHKRLIEIAKQCETLEREQEKIRESLNSRGIRVEELCASVGNDLPDRAL